MAISALQKERAAYAPKLPKSLKGNVKVVDGNATQSVANQSEIKELFPNTYGMPIVTFEEGSQLENVCLTNALFLWSMSLRNCLALL